VTTERSLIDLSIVSAGEGHPPPASTAPRGSAQTGSPGTDDNHIKRVVDEVVCARRTHVVPR
jgi:hypothetical protein